MAANYIIKTENNDFFCGWNLFGEIIIKHENFANLAYRMSRPLAERNIEKIENFTKQKCSICSVKA